MTTAARPTWAPAKGGNEQGGTRIFGPSQKYSSRDIASHTTLKPRYEPEPFRACTGVLRVNMLSIVMLRLPKLFRSGS